MNKTIAETILRQLGGSRFIAMTGAKNFSTNGNDLCFSVGKNKSKANRVKIILDLDDTYRVQFIKFIEAKFNTKTFQFTESKVEMLEELEMIYCEQLQEVFTNYTGLYTRL